MRRSEQITALPLKPLASTVFERNVQPPLNETSNALDGSSCPDQELSCHIGVCPIVLSDTLFPAPARHSYPRFRLPPISKKRKKFILRSTKRNKDHDDPSREDKTQQSLHRPPGQHAGRASREGLGGPPSESPADVPVTGSQKYTQGDTTMKERAKNVKTNKKYWTDPMNFPVYTPKRGR